MVTPSWGVTVGATPLAVSVKSSSKGVPWGVVRASNPWSMSMHEVPFDVPS